MAKKVILITNDDGILAPGIMALANAVKSLGEVHVVAPLCSILLLSYPLSFQQTLCS